MLSQRFASQGDLLEGFTLGLKNRDEFEALPSKSTSRFRCHKGDPMSMSIPNATIDCRDGAGPSQLHAL